MGLNTIRGGQVRRVTAFNTAQSSSSSTTFTTHLAQALSAGQWIISYSAEIKRNGNTAIEARFMVGATEYGQSITSNTNFQSFAGVVPVTLATPQSAVIEFRSMQTNRVVDIRRSAIHAVRSI